MFVKDITENEINEIVLQFQSRTSTDHTNFSMAFVDKCFSCISLPFTFICSKSFSNGTFPYSLKIAKVIPHIYFMLDDFISKNNILSNNQYGFRKGRSSAMAWHGMAMA